MGADLIVVPAPILDDDPCLQAITKPLHGQTLVTEFAVKAFIGAVLPRLACNDPAFPAHIKPLMRKLARAFSFSAPGAAADGYKSVSTRRSHGWRAGCSRSVAGVYIVL